MRRRRQAYESVDRLIAVDGALARTGIELRSFAQQIGVSPEQLRDALAILEDLGQTIRHEVFDGERHFYSYAKDQLPLFSKNVPICCGLGVHT